MTAIDKLSTDKLIDGEKLGQINPIANFVNLKKSTKNTNPEIQNKSQSGSFHENTENCDKKDSDSKAAKILYYDLNANFKVEQSIVKVKKPLLKRSKSKKSSKNIRNPDNIKQNELIDISSIQKLNLIDKKIKKE